MANERVREVMTPAPATIGAQASAVEATGLMASQDVGSLPVVDNDTLVGMVTDRDLVLHVLAKDVDPIRPPSPRCARRIPSSSGRKTRSTRRSSGWHERRSGDFRSSRKSSSSGSSLRPMCPGQPSRLPRVAWSRKSPRADQATGRTDVGTRATKTVSHTSSPRRPASTPSVSRLRTSASPLSPSTSGRKGPTETATRSSCAWISTVASSPAEASSMLSTASWRSSIRSSAGRCGSRLLREPGSGHLETTDATETKARSCRSRAPAGSWCTCELAIIA